MAVTHKLVMIDAMLIELKLRKRTTIFASNPCTQQSLKIVQFATMKFS